MSNSKDNLEREFHHTYRDLPKVQRMVAQIGQRYNLNIIQRYKDHLIHKFELLNTEAAILSVIIKKKCEAVEI